MSKAPKDRLPLDDLALGLTPEPRRPLHEGADQGFAEIEMDWEDPSAEEDDDEWGSLSDLELDLDRMLAEEAGDDEDGLAEEFDPLVDQVGDLSAGEGSHALHDPVGKADRADGLGEFVSPNGSPYGQESVAVGEGVAKRKASAPKPRMDDLAAALTPYPQKQSEARPLSPDQPDRSFDDGVDVDQETDHPLSDVAQEPFEPAPVYETEDEDEELSAGEATLWQRWDGGMRHAEGEADAETPSYDDEPVARLPDDLPPLEADPAAPASDGALMTNPLEAAGLSDLSAEDAFLEEEEALYAEHEGQEDLGSFHYADEASSLGEAAPYEESAAYNDNPADYVASTGHPEQFEAGGLEEAYEEPMALAAGGGAGAMAASPQPSFQASPRRDQQPGPQGGSRQEPGAGPKQGPRPMTAAEAALAGDPGPQKEPHKLPQNTVPELDFDQLEEQIEISEQPFYNAENADYDLPDDVFAPDLHSDRPVPRISIQAFCDDPKNGVVIQKAAEDRRLAKAHVTVHMGGMQGAVEYFRETPTPNLLFIEVPNQGREIFEKLEELSQVCDPGTKVVLIGRINDVTLYRALIRQGVSEYLVPPLNVPQVIDTVASLYIDPEAPPIGRCISFIGAKGGVGSSVLAHNVAWLIAENLMEDVTLVDFDLHFGTASLDFNQEPTQGVADALTSPERLDDQLLERLLVRCTDRLSLFSAPGSLERTFEIDQEAYESVIDIVRGGVPVVVTDLPHTWDTWTRRILSSSEEIVITATPDLACLRNTKNMIDLLKVARPNDADPKLVINQVGIAKRPEIPVKDFAEAVGLEPALVLPFDPQLFGAAGNSGQMLAELKPDSKATAGLVHLATSLSSREASEPEAKSVTNVIKALFKRK